jgi:NAD(P)-dependent dehydrogenase (short-subunit alcohol dehydrogenase family)
MSQEVVNCALKGISDKLEAQYAHKVTFVKCDLDDWHASANATKEISSHTDRLDILALNSARGNHNLPAD